IELSEIVSLRYRRNRVEKFHVTDASVLYCDSAGHRCRGEFVVVTGPMKIAGSCAGKAAVPGFGHPFANRQVVPVENKIGMLFSADRGGALSVDAAVAGIEVEIVQAEKLFRDEKMNTAHCQVGRTRIF